MLSIINISIFALWLLSALGDYFELSYYWQLKEWRWDRAKDFLSTEQGRRFIFQKRILLRIFLIILSFFLPFNIFINKLILIFVLLLDLINFLFRLFTKKLYRPIFTKKAILIILVTISLEGLMFLRSRDWDTLLLLIMIRVLLIGFVIYFVNILTNLLKKYYIRMATIKIARYKNLTIIGITGSYGKTTVKIFLQHILSHKFDVVCTPKHINTEIGIAKFILSHNFSKNNIFIVEMGAYKEGEIRLICDMVHPKIGILTAISEQHLSLYGDIKITQKTKYELLRSLPNDGLAVTNSDNEYCREFLSELKCQVRTFGIEETFHPTILIKNINDTLSGGTCTVQFQGREEMTIQSILRGAHNTLNVMPCVLVADFLGMKSDEIISASQSLPQTIQIFKYGNCEIINDSYNSNPKGFKAVLDYMNKYDSSKKRIVVTRGMLELGSKSNELHEMIGGEISFVADELVLITPDFLEPIQRGLVEKYNIFLKTIFEPKELLSYIRNLKNSNSVILFENRMPALVMKEIIDNSVEV